MQYRKYDPMVKKLIIKTGNRNLFPELNIPRTTINYWLQRSREVTTSDRDKVYESAMKSLTKENYEERAKSHLMKRCLEEILKNSEYYNLTSKKNRKLVLDIVEDFKEILGVKKVISIIGISASTYYRWRTESFGCNYNQFKKCSVARPNQISRDEQSLLVKYATAKEFRKFSTVSLVYYCKRKNLLNISLETWYKYLKLYGIDRKNKRFKKITYRNGLRAKKKDEYWHIDITEIPFGEKQKAYLQLVVDNYSRLIISWKLSLRKDMNLTYKTLKKSFTFSDGFNGTLISDGGGENIGKVPQQLLIGRGIKQLIAKKDIRYSNSMVEAVFRQLKQRFIYKKPSSYSSVYTLVYKFVSHYNKKIPHTMLNGATPLEFYFGSFDFKQFREFYTGNAKEITERRRVDYLGCIKCQRKFTRSDLRV